MKISGTGAAVGAAIGFVARGTVVLLNFGGAAGVVGILALPSAAIGALAGAIAGATGKPLRGALVGAVLSGVVFEFFMFACASLIGRLDQKAGGDFLTQTLVYGLEMAIAGAIAGGLGGAVSNRSASLPPGTPSQNPNDSRTRPNEDAHGQQS